MNSLNVPKLRFPGFDGEWEKIKLGNKIEIISGFAFKGDLFGDVGRKLVIPKNFTKIGYGNFTPKFTKFTTEECDEKLACNEGDLLVLLTDLTQSCELLGKPLLIMKEDGEVLLNQRVIKIKTNENLEKVFLMNFLLTKNYHKYIVETSSGTTVRHSSNKIILKTKLSIPEVQEQQKIASFLSAVDKKIQQLSRKKELLGQYKKGVMQQLFSGKLHFKDENGKDYPDWEEKKLGEVAEKRIAKNKDNKINLVFTNSAVQGIVNQRDFFDKDIANQNNLLGYYIVEKNDFVYNPRISSQAPVGPISRNYLDTGIMSPLYSVFRFREGNLDFIKCFFNSIVWHKHMKDISNYGARDDRMSFSTADFYKMPIPFPCIEEQQKIANFLSGIDGKIEQVNGELVKTQEFKKGLLQQLFV
jgi:type I restriction enzyme S subunit